MDTRTCFALALLLCGCPSQTIDGAPSDPALDANETTALAELDALRQAAGIGTPLVDCKALDVAASLHSDDMRGGAFLSDTGSDGSDVRGRACAAGYQPACTKSASMAELVSSGFDDGKEVVDQWAGKAENQASLLDPTLTVVGIGEAIDAENTIYFTVILSSHQDASCQ